MGLFDAFKKRKNETQGSSIERDVTQAVALCMHTMGITQMPVLKFLYNDKGIFEGVFQSHMNDPQVDLIHKMYGDDIYLNLLGSHSLGVGVYVLFSQTKFKKPVDEWTMNEAAKVASDIHETDPYELAIKSLGFALDGNNKKCMDKIVQIGAEAYKSAAKNNIMDKNNLKTFMKVMYNAGVTLIMRG